MEPTKKLYESEPTACEFTAQVLACTPGRGGFAVVLDASAFFPEGGGQPADRGTLGGRQVLDVQEAAGIITHTLDGPLDVGDEVSGQVDADFRLDASQQHTGEHILSGILHALWGVENVGFHIGEDAVRVDTSLELSSEQLAEAERAANAVVWADKPIHAWYPDAAELASLPYRSKKELNGAVRIVEVPGADCCACCGTHVQRTGQVGVIKIVGAQNYKGGTRLTLLCGGRALADYATKCDEDAAISTLLSAKTNHLLPAVERLKEENAALHAQLAESDGRYFALLAAGVASGDAPVLLCEGLAPDSLRRLCLALCEKTDRVCAVCSPGAAGLAYAIGRAGGDVRALVKEMNAALQGRGGGKPELCQGSVAAPFEEIKEFLKNATSV